MFPNKHSFSKVKSLTKKFSTHGFYLQFLTTIDNLIFVDITFTLNQNVSENSVWELYIEIYWYCFLSNYGRFF